MRYTQQKYSGVKRIYHNISTGYTSYERSDKRQTRFDSTQEFKTFILLEECLNPSLYDIGVHPTLSVNGIDWEIDFSVSAIANNARASMSLASVVNAIQGTEHLSLNRIFIEYKGLQDKNFLAKMQNVVVSAPTFSKTIVLVSDHVSAFGCYSREKERFYCHPITSLHILELILKAHT